MLPSLGLHYLAAALELRGDKVEVMEGYGMAAEEMTRRIAIFAPDVVGITVQTPVWPDARRLITLLRQRLPHTKLVIGGAHVNLRHEQLLEEAPELDAAFVGAGEDSFPDWIHSLNGAMPPTLVPAASKERALAHEPGFATRVQGRIPWHTYIPNLMFACHKRFATSVSTLGCASSCSFCGLTRQFQGRWTRPAESVLEEMTYLSQERRIRVVNFMDDNTLFAHGGDETDELLEEMIRRKLDIEWTIYMNNFDIDDRRLRLMKRAGCRRTLILVESGSQRVANIAHGKEISLDSIARTVRRVDAAGIEACARFQIGFASETWDDAMESIRFSEELPLALASFVKTLILPGSMIAKRALRAGRAATEDDRWSYYGRPVPPDAMTATEQEALVKLGVRSFARKQLVTGRLFRMPLPLHIARRVLVDGTE